MTVRNRKKGVRRVRAGDLIPHPQNWRLHPPTQRAAMEAILEEVGDIDFLKVVETPGGLMLVDGHLRADIQADSEVDVVVLDLDPQEQAKVLATFDPLAAMAQTDMDQFLALAETIKSESQMINDLLEAVANNERVPLPDIPAEEWDGMPEMENEGMPEFRTIIVHFPDQESVDGFAELIGQTITPKMKFLRHPEVPRGKRGEYVDES
jgi:hypothetical protein